MFQSVRDFLRRRDLRKHSSTVPTGIRPLAGIRKVAVFLPAAEADAPTLSLIRDALNGKELSIFVISPERKASPVSGAVLLTPSHMNILGRVSSSHKVHYQVILVITLIWQSVATDSLYWQMSLMILLQPITATEPIPESVLLN